MKICLKGNLISVSLISLSHHLWWLVMSNYAFTSLTHVWCEVNVFLILYFYIFLCYLLFCFSLFLSFFLLCICYCLYTCLFFSNTIRPRTNVQKL